MKMPGSPSLAFTEIPLAIISRLSEVIGGARQYYREEDAPYTHQVPRMTGENTHRKPFIHKLHAYYTHTKNLKYKY